MDAHLCSNLISYFKRQVDTCVWTMAKCVCAKSGEKILKNKQKKTDLMLSVLTKQKASHTKEHRKIFGGCGNSIMTICIYLNSSRCIH